MRMELGLKMLCTCNSFMHAAGYNTGAPCPSDLPSPAPCSLQGKGSVGEGVIFAGLPEQDVAPESSDEDALMVLPQARAQ